MPATAKVWTIGNTTARNPERLPVGLKIFNRYYDGTESFSGNIEKQEEFFGKLVTHTLTGEPYNPRNPTAPPFYAFVSEDMKVSMSSSAYKQKNGRLWLSPLDDLGLISAYGSTQAQTKPPGKLLAEIPELSGLVWLRQLLKFQYPNPKSRIAEGATLRPAVLVFKLMLELGGLSDFEIGLCHLTRDEQIEDFVGLIRAYRRRQKKEKTTDLRHEILTERISKHFSADIEERLGQLRSICQEDRSSPVEEETIREQINRIVALGKGAKTKKARICRDELIRTAKAENASFEDLKKEFLGYYFLVKGNTIRKDYPDLTKRYLSMTGMLQTYRDHGSRRLRIDPRYAEMVKDALGRLPEIRPMQTEDNYSDYWNYLWDPNKPTLEVDRPDFLHGAISNIKDELRRLNWECPPIENLGTDLVAKELLEYAVLTRQLDLAREAEYANSLTRDRVIAHLDLLKEKPMPRAISPTDIEAWIWESLLLIGGYVCHPSKTRNFHIDSVFNAIFTAAGDQPDMQFPYEKIDIVVEVTKMMGKTQWRSEAEPVTRHVATYSFFTKRPTLGIFVAPAIHDETLGEFYKRSKGEEVIIYTNGTSERIEIVPITFSQYYELYQKISDELATPEERRQRWLQIISSLRESIRVSASTEQWNSHIKSLVSMLAGSNQPEG